MLFYQPFNDISVVIRQVTSPDELWDLNGFSHSCGESSVLTSYHHKVAALSFDYWLKLSNVTKSVTLRMNEYGKGYGYIFKVNLKGGDVAVDNKSLKKNSRKLTVQTVIPTL